MRFSCSKVENYVTFKEFKIEFYDWYSLIFAHLLNFFFFFFFPSWNLGWKLKETNYKRLLFRSFFRLPSHVLSVGGMTLLGPGSFWGVASGTQHWATWSNDYRYIFKPTKLLKPKSKNHDNGQINIQYAFDIIALISSCNKVVLI